MSRVLISTPFSSLHWEFGTAVGLKRGANIVIAHLINYFQSNPILFTAFEIVRGWMLVVQESNPEGQEEGKREKYKIERVSYNFNLFFYPPG